MSCQLALSSIQSGVVRGRWLAEVEANRTLLWAVIALVAGTYSVSRWRQRSTRASKAVLRAAGNRPVLGMFLNDPLDVLAEVAGYVEESGFARCCLPAWKVDREPGTV